MKRLIITAALALAGCGLGRPSSAPAPGYEDLAAYQIAARVVSTNDPLDGYRHAHSDNLRPMYPPGGGLRSDIFFRAINVPGQPPRVSIIVRTESDKDWARPSSINFGEPLRIVPLTRSDLDAKCYTTTCFHREVSEAVLSADDVAWMLGQAPELFTLRIKTRVGDADRRLRIDELRAVMSMAGIE